MPTVFRKKVDTVLRNEPLEARSQYLTSQYSANISNQGYNYNQRETSAQRRQAEGNSGNGNQSQRVEYMLITKRIDLKDCEEEQMQIMQEERPIEQIQAHTVMLVEKEQPKEMPPTYI